jgi:mRNA-degrading endonuclease YafQ of YafQ-DinJ toxin-antitoxin module
MTKVAFSSSFKRAFKKKIKKQKTFEDKFWEKVDIFIHNPFDNRLRTHKLSGKLRELSAFSIDYDNRVVFYFEDDRAIFVDIGPHDDVY